MGWLSRLLLVFVAFCTWPNSTSFRPLKWSTLHRCDKNANRLSMILEPSSISPVLASTACVAGVIAIHEAGHYLAARTQGIKVTSFNIGYGPKLLSYNESSSGTEFALRTVPLGGYVAFPSNAEYDEEGNVIKELDDPNLLENRPVVQRMKVIVAGIVANLLLSFTLTTTAALTTGISIPTFDHGVIVQSVSSTTSPASIAGIKSNDIIKSVNGKLLKDSSLSVSEFINLVRKNEGKSLLLTVDRPTTTSDAVEETSVRVIPQRNQDGVVSIGLGIAPNIKSLIPEKANNIIDGLRLGYKQFIAVIFATWESLVTVFQNGLGAGNLMGPVSVVSEGAKLAKKSPTSLLVFASNLSINLAILNALPLPALDGGQFVFALGELLLKKKLPRETQQTLTFTAFMLLLGLGVYSFIGDLSRLGF